MYMKCNVYPKLHVYDITISNKESLKYISQVFQDFIDMNMAKVNRYGCQIMDT